MIRSRHRSAVALLAAACVAAGATSACSKSNDAAGAAATTTTTAAATGPKTHETCQLATADDVAAIFGPSPTSGPGLAGGTCEWRDAGKKRSLIIDATDMGSAGAATDFMKLQTKPALPVGDVGQALDTGIRFAKGQWVVTASFVGDKPSADQLTQLGRAMANRVG